MKEASSGRRRVAPELQAYEDARQLALLRAQAAGGSLRNVWPASVPFEIFVYLSTSSEPLTAFAAAPEGEGALGGGLANASFGGLLEGQGAVAAAADGGAPAAHAPSLLWHQRGLSYDDAARNTREQHFNVSLPASVRQNASSVYAHVFFCLGGGSPAEATRADPFAPTLPSGGRVLHAVVPLMKLLAQKPKKATFNLLGAGGGGGEEEKGEKAGPRTMRFGIGLAEEATPSAAPPAEAGSEEGADAAAAAPSAAAANVTRYLPYFKPTLHLQLVNDRSVVPVSQLPPGMGAAIFAVPDAVGGFGYAPILYVNEFWMREHDLAAVNESVLSVPLLISYSTQSMWKWAMQTQMTTSWEVQAQMGASKGDSDLIKTILLDTNPWLLLLTVVVTTLHSVFDFLAFRNDISFWRSAKSLEGLSMRTVALNVFFQAVIFLYLIENETSWMVLASTGVGLLIEIWKLLRSLGGRIAWERGRLPRIDWGTDAPAGGSEAALAISKTQEYDSIATGHLLYCIYPLVVGYAAYSLMYERHRGWYSWIINSLVGFIYVFGFIQMVPQLYINYRLKSVAHLPWKTMVYKS
jgi:hypothetical protein